MSHITEVKTNFRSLADLGEAAALLGGELREGQTTHRTYGRFVGDSDEGRRFVEERGAAEIGKCEHAIVVKGNAGGYEVGVVRSQDGDGYALVFDAWGPGQRLEQAFGKNLDRLKQEYAVAVATKKARETLGRKGFAITRENLAGGRVRLRLKKR